MKKKNLYSNFRNKNIIDTINQKIAPMLDACDFTLEKYADFLDNLDKNLNKIFINRTEKMFYSCLVNLFCFTLYDPLQKSYTHISLHDDELVNRFKMYRERQQSIVDNERFISDTERFFDPDLPTPQAFKNMISQEKYRWLEKLNQYGFSDANLLFLFERMQNTEYCDLITLQNVGQAKLYHFRNIRVSERRRLKKKIKNEDAECLVKTPYIAEGGAKNHVENVKKMDKNLKKNGVCVDLKLKKKGGLSKNDLVCY